MELSVEKSGWGVASQCGDVCACPDLAPARGPRAGWPGIVFAVVFFLTNMGEARAQDSAPAAGVVKAPFASVDFPAQVDQGVSILWEESLARSAVETGLNGVAEGIYRRVLKEKDLAAPVKQRLELGLITCLIAQQDVDGARLALEHFSGPHDAAWQLRGAAIHYLAASAREVKPDEEKTEYASLEEAMKDLKPDSLTGGEAGWYHFLRAVLADRARDAAQATQEYDQAAAATTSAVQQAEFNLARFQSTLRLGDPSEAEIAQLRQRVDQHQGQSLGFQFTLLYAAVLDRAGRTPEAIAILRRQKDNVALIDPDLRDKTLLLLGLVAGAGSKEGRDAYRELLDTGSDGDFQRTALVRLAAGTTVDGGDGTAAFQKILDDLLARVPPHPLTEDLLFFRAELALRAKKFERAEEDARALLTRFPLSRLKRNALALMASSSWQRGERFRTAADYIARIRADGETPAGEKAALGVLLGECYFRAGEKGTADDFRNAAEAYGSALGADARQTGVSAGAIFYQRVLSLVNAGEPRDITAAAALLDDPAMRAGVDTESWWQAEWNLERTLQLKGQHAEALKRVETIGPAIGVPPELKLRLLWLAAQLTLDAHRSADETKDRVERVREFLSSPEGARVDATLRQEVASNAALLAAKARYQGGDREGGLQAMEQLRTDFPGSRAAVYSFIDQARFLATENRLVDAQQLLITLADRNPTSEYAPLALYEAAFLSDRRGQEEHWQEANRLLERIATDERYRKSPFLFPARMKQADLMRKLNRFDVAEQIYRQLEADFPTHEDRLLVQISLADALMAEASIDPSKFEGAVSRLERLVASESAPIELRAEAGVKLASGWRAQGNIDRASEVYWDVYRRFLRDDKTAAKLSATATGPYWVSRAVIELAQLEERANHNDNARMLYEAVIKHGLPGDRVARGRLARFSAALPGG